jgi:bacterioferritin-associated ferredoxin
MYICVCNGVTERDICEAVKQGAVRMRDLRSCLGVTGQCGVCACYAKLTLDKVLQHQELLQKTVQPAVSPS